MILVVRADMLAGEALRAETDDEMVGVNLAVCLLYVGRMQEVRGWCFVVLAVDRHAGCPMMAADVKQGRALLEQLVDSGRSSHTLLFNLSTMYELCTDRSRALKVRLSEKVAAMEPRPEGWEKTNADFKL